MKDWVAWHAAYDDPSSSLSSYLKRPITPVAGNCGNVLIRQPEFRLPSDEEIRAFSAFRPDLA
ncbi:MAG: hypothetical protein JO132_06000 [Streptosporangiaceae bacterium]|nr:hypothetical protein [Streptosporangiaceae bacterium]